MDKKDSPGSFDLKDNSMRSVKRIIQNNQLDNIDQNSIVMQNSIVGDLSDKN